MFHRHVYSQDIVAPCCSAGLLCHGAAFPSPPTARQVWETAHISSACCFSRLSTGDWRQLMAYSLSGSFQSYRTWSECWHVILRSAFYENKLRVFWGALKPHELKTSHCWLSKWSDRLSHPVLVPLSDKTNEFFTPHDVSLGAKRNTVSIGEWINVNSVMTRYFKITVSYPLVFFFFSLPFSSVRTCLHVTITKRIQRKKTRKLPWHSVASVISCKSLLMENNYGGSESTVIDFSHKEGRMLDLL